MLRLTVRLVDVADVRSFHAVHDAHRSDINMQNGKINCSVDFGNYSIDSIQIAKGRLWRRRHHTRSKQRWCKCVRETHWAANINIQFTLVIRIRSTDGMHDRTRVWGKYWLGCRRRVPTHSNLPIDRNWQTHSYSSSEQSNEPERGARDRERKWERERATDEKRSDYRYTCKHYLFRWSLVSSRFAPNRISFSRTKGTREKKTSKIWFAT